MAKEFTKDDDALLAKLGVKVETKKAESHTPREQRIIAGFEEIQQFRKEHDRPPQHGEHRDIFERLYAVRLDRIRSLSEACELVEPLDHQGLLAGQQSNLKSMTDDLDDDALLAELGIESETPPITQLRHVRPAAEKRAAEEVASRTQCTDFDKFKPLFNQVQKELDTGLRETRPFENRAEIEQGRFFILGGQKAYIAEIGEFFTQEYGDRDARMRVIFDNGTESNMLMRSFQRAMNKDSAGRRVIDLNVGPLFAKETDEGDEASGTIYVLRSKSDLPLVSANRELIHKIGVTNNDVERRITRANLDPTFLMADVEIVATYELFNINRAKLENLIHRIFSSARLDIEVMDRFGNPVVPREWFLVPLYAIDDAVQKIDDGTITNYRYDPKKAKLVELDESS